MPDSVRPDSAAAPSGVEPGERLAMIMAQHGMARYADGPTIAQWSDRREPSTEPATDPATDPGSGPGRDDRLD